MSKRLTVRMLILSALFALFATGNANAQEKNFSPYWAWSNVFYGSFTSFTFGTGSNPTWSATYNYPSGHLYGYPASVRGWHYGYNPTGDGMFPKQMSTITHIPANFSYYANGTDMGGDFTYDMFLRWDGHTNNASGDTTPQLEVMVWGTNNSYPISNTGQPIVASALTVNGVVYDLYLGWNSAAQYNTYTFLPHRSSPPATLPLGNGTLNVDLRQFFNVLKGLPSSHYSEYMYLDVVEAGIEVTKGNGVAKTTYFTVDAY